MATIEIFYGDCSQHIPAKHEVCPRCGGEGKHVNPAIDGNGLTAADFDEAGDEFREDYMGGAYDVTCETCGGRNVVLVADLERCDAEQRAAAEQSTREHQEMERNERAERRCFGTEY